MIKKLIGRKVVALIVITCGAIIIASGCKEKVPKKVEGRRMTTLPIYFGDIKGPNRLRCSAVKVTDELLLTAAHCPYGLEGKKDRSPYYIIINNIGDKLQIVDSGVFKPKEGKMSDEEYTREYYEMMRRSYRENRRRWDEVLDMEEVVLACYCPVDSFCHRYLLRDMLVKCGAEYAGEITERGNGFAGH